MDINDATELTNGSTLGEVIEYYKANRRRAEKALELATNSLAHRRSVSLKQTRANYYTAAGQLQGAMNMARLLGYNPDSTT